MATTNWLMASPTPSVFLHPSGSPRLAFASIKNQTLVKTRVSFLANAKRRLPVVLSMTATEEGAVKSVLPGNGISIMVNGCTGKMGKAVIKAADTAGVNIVPTSFGSASEAGQTVEVCGKEITVHGPTEREEVLSSVFEKHPELIVVDYTIPTAVNDNAELYSRVGVPFVMGTTGGDREKLYESVEKAKIYAVISPQMGKQVVAFLAAMEIMAEQFPGAFSGYSLEVMESHQASKLDASGTAKAVISCFQELGVSYDMDQIQLIRDPKQQVEMVGVPEEHVSGHAFHLYHLTSPDETVSFEFQHNVCGRSIYAEGTVDAVLFLAKKVRFRSYWLCEVVVDSVSIVTDGTRVSLLVWSAQLSSGFGELGLPIRSTPPSMSDSFLFFELLSDSFYYCCQYWITDKIGFHRFRLVKSH
ncbi:unnamed protein product [Brassica oleracea]